MQCFDLNTMWCPLRSTSICQAPLQPMCYSSAFCWGVLSAVSSCRTPLLKNFYKFPLRCTPSTGTKSLNELLLELSSVACSFHTWDTKIRFSTYCWWSTSFFLGNFRRFRLSRWPHFRSQLHWLVHYQPDSSNCTTLPLRANRLVWVQYFTSSLTELCHLSNFAAFHTLNRFYDRHLVCSF